MWADTSWAEVDDEEFQQYYSAPRRDSGQITGKRKRVESEDRGYGDGQQGSSELDVDEEVKARDGEGDGESESDDESEYDYESEEIESEEWEARMARRDPGLGITDPGSKMKAGKGTRFHAKVAMRMGKEYQDGRAKISTVVEEDVRMPSHSPVVLARVDLSILQMPGCGHTASQLELVRFPMGPRVLPLLKQWAFMWHNPDDRSKDFRELVQKRFPSNQRPWDQEVELIAKFATRERAYCHKSTELLYRMASFSERLVNANSTINDFDFFARFGQEGWASDAPYKFAARLLLAVWEDIKADANGLFGKLFHEQCELSRQNRPEVRKAYLAWYTLDKSLYSTMPTLNVPAPPPTPIVMPVSITAIQFPASTKPARSTVKAEGSESKKGKEVKPVPVWKPYATGEI